MLVGGRRLPRRAETSCVRLGAWRRCLAMYRVCAALVYIMAIGRTRSPNTVRDNAIITGRGTTVEEFLSIFTSCKIELTTFRTRNNSETATYFWHMRPSRNDSYNREMQFNRSYNQGFRLLGIFIVAMVKSFGTMYILCHGPLLAQSTLRVGVFLWYCGSC